MFSSARRGLNVLNRSMVCVEEHPLSTLEGQTLRWEEVTQIKLLNLFGLSIQEVGPASMSQRELWLARMSWCRTMISVPVDKTISKNGPTESA